jgi:hypothetical protein
MQPRRGRSFSWMLLADARRRPRTWRRCGSRQRGGGAELKEMVAGREWLERRAWGFEMAGVAPGMGQCASVIEPARAFPCDDRHLPRWRGCHFIHFSAGSRHFRNGARPALVSSLSRTPLGSHQCGRPQAGGSRSCADRIFRVVPRSGTVTATPPRAVSAPPRYCRGRAHAAFHVHRKGGGGIPGRAGAGGRPRGRVLYDGGSATLGGFCPLFYISRRPNLDESLAAHPSWLRGDPSVSHVPIACTDITDLILVDSGGQQWKRAAPGGAALRTGLFLLDPLS